MKKLFIFSLLLIVACGPSEEEIQARINDAVEQAIEQATSTSSSSSTSTTSTSSTLPLSTSSTSSTTTSSSSTSTTTTTILKYQKNPNTLLPKIKNLRVYVDTNSEVKVEIIIELGYKVSEKMLDEVYADLQIVFVMCYDYSGTTLNESTSNNYQKCDGPYGWINTWNYIAYQNTGSFYSSFNATKIDDYTIKYDLAPWLTNRENLKQSERFFQLDRILFRAFEYGNEDCTIDIRIDARLLKYTVEKHDSFELVTCNNIDDKYSLDINEISSFESFWNGKYFNGIPSFKVGNSSNSNETNSNISDSSDEVASSDVNVIQIDNSFQGTIGSQQVNVIQIDNSFQGTIGSQQVNVIQLDNSFQGTIGSQQVNVIQIGSDFIGSGPLESLILFFGSN